MGRASELNVQFSNYRLVESLGRVLTSNVLVVD